MYNLPKTDNNSNLKEHHRDIQLKVYGFAIENRPCNKDCPEPSAVAKYSQDHGHVACYNLIEWFILMNDERIDTENFYWFLGY